MTSVLPNSFYDRDVVQVAVELLGKQLIRRTREGTSRGRIVEVEAYLAKGDPACHASRGRTPGNAAMFGPPGTAYVYPIHGRCCFNVVTEAPGRPSAVLIRALEPIAGEKLMTRRRGTGPPEDLLRGPARLCEAMAITRAHNQQLLTTGKQLWLAPMTEDERPLEILSSRRIGVTRAQHRQLRFFLPNCRAVSGPRKVSSWRRIRVPYR